MNILYKTQQMAVSPRSVTMWNPNSLSIFHIVRVKTSLIFTLNGAFAYIDFLKTLSHEIFRNKPIESFSISKCWHIAIYMSKTSYSLRHHFSHEEDFVSTRELSSSWWQTPLFPKLLLFIWQFKYHHCQQVCTAVFQAHFFHFQETICQTPKCIEFM